MWQFLISAFSFCGGVSGLLALLLIVFKGGALVQHIDDMDKRLTEVYSFATPTAREHVKIDDMRDSNLADRVKSVEQAVLTLSDLKVRLELNAEKLDEMRRTQDRIEKSLVEKR